MKLESSVKADAGDGPLLTIGMPVYNNGTTISRALDSLLAQSYRRFRLVVSDDNSSDDTAEVCERYAARDERVRLVRQARNLNYGNFRFVLQQADTPFFMFAAGDDYWHPEYAARLIDALESNAAAVCAVSRVVFVKNGAVVTEASGTRALDADPATNIARFLAAADDNSRMYGVFRTSTAQRAFPPTDFFAFDWGFSIGTLLDGIHLELRDVMLWRDYTSPDRYIHYVRRDARNGIDRLFPMLPLTRYIGRRLRVPTTYPVARQLVSLNVAFHLLYLRQYHPSVASIEQGVIAAVRRTRRLIGRSRRLRSNS
jgi:glycosyltransferase involved in cell wall biosynthesis